MFIEIEETVCFLASHLYGKLPRSRVDAFNQHVANGLAERLYQDACRPATHFRLIVKLDGCGDLILYKAAEQSFLNVHLLLSLLPSQFAIDLEKGNVRAVYLESGEFKQIYSAQQIATKEKPAAAKSDQVKWKKSSSKKKGSAKHEIIEDHNELAGVSCMELHRVDDAIFARRPQFHVEFSLPTGFEKNASAVPRPYFEVQHEEQIYTAQAFAATRFGSTKLKTFRENSSIESHRYFSNLSSVNNPMANRSHPFTMPSIYAYLQLLAFLNAIACIPMLPKSEEKRKTEEMTNNAASNSFSHLTASLTSTSARGSVTAETYSDSSEDALTDQLLKCSSAQRKAFQSGDSHDSGAYCIGEHEIFTRKVSATSSEASYSN